MLNAVQLNLWHLLEVAERHPAEADFGDIWTELDAAMEIQDSCLQLQIAGDAIARISDVFAQRSDLAFQDLEAAAAHDGPIMSLDEFDRYVRQSMQIDLNDYIESIASLPGLPLDQDLTNKPSTESDDDDSLVREVSKSALLDVLDRLTLPPPITEAEQIQQIKSLSHGENVPLCSSQLKTYLRTALSSSNRSIALLDLPKALGMPIAEVWLGFLLGDHDYQLRRTSDDDFYSADYIEVVLKSDLVIVQGGG